MPGAELSCDQRRLLQRFSPELSWCGATDSHASEDILLKANTDTIGFFIAKFSKRTPVLPNTCSWNGWRREMETSVRGGSGERTAWMEGREGVVPCVVLLPLPWQQWRNGCYGNRWVCVTIGLWPGSSMQPEDTMVLIVSHTHSKWLAADFWTNWKFVY